MGSNVAFRFSIIFPPRKIFPPVHIQLLFPTEGEYLGDAMDFAGESEMHQYHFPEVYTPFHVHAPAENHTA